MKKQVTATALAVALAAGVLSGCGGSDSTEGASSTASQATLQETGTVTYPVESNGEKLTIWCPMQPPAAKYITSYNDQEVFQEISKRTGIEVEFIHPALGQEREQLGLLIASGELPDIIQIRGFYPGGAAAGVDDGVFLDMTDLMAQYAPDYYKIITSSDEAWRLATSNDNRITDFNIIKQSAPAFTRINFLDTTVEKYGMTEMPVTIEDYDELFAKMQADGLPGFAPDGNGRVEQFMWPYGITPEYSLDTEGNLQYGPYTEAYKDYLTMMNSWYTKGYLYKDFMSNLTANDRMSLFVNGQVGMMVNPVDLATNNARAQGHEISIANYPRLEEGQEIPFETVSWDTLPITNEPMTTVISADSDNKELAMQYLNYFYTQEGADLCNWGIEGKTYVVKEDGTKEYTDYMFNNPDIALADAQTMLKIHLCAKLAEPDVVCNPNILVDEEAGKLRNMYSDDTTVNDSRTMPVFSMSLEASTERAEIMRDINTYIDEMTLKFITGATPLSEFDTYMQTLKDMGIEDAIQITTDEYQRFMEKKAPVA